ncbi:DUF1853 family protein [Pelagicoccus enzymogenes]|uniref:DUF1853 family protein n=1 Tax=Pelagicoccus enzymogenes TaxID=2773457 RepID=UPI0028104616|nr:DUF1853 family protein [Pelagicoccus enzymogenes]MDQ8197377.1 DUF1853 family protein [Pelagicoccus enzymogenes]
MRSIESLYTEALLRSLRDAPLLVGNLPEAPARELVLEVPSQGEPLNFEQKLGHLYEDALEALIRGSDRYELLAKNLQVEGSDGRTLGELDFLLKELYSGEVWHLELAVKFYLSVEDENGRIRFPGPDPRDNWINKLQKMRSRQLRICERPETQGLLFDRFGIRKLTTCQRIYGILFDWMGSGCESSPPAVRRNCRRGRWLRVKEWEDFYAADAAVRIVPKCLWPVVPDEALLAAWETVDVKELKRQASERCVMFWDEVKGEVAFLVADTWLAES